MGSWIVTRGTSGLVFFFIVYQAMCGYRIWRTECTQSVEKHEALVYSSCSDPDTVSTRYGGRTYDCERIRHDVAMGPMWTALETWWRDAPWTDAMHRLLRMTHNAWALTAMGCTAIAMCIVSCAWVTTKDRSERRMIHQQQQSEERMILHQQHSQQQLVQLARTMSQPHMSQSMHHTPMALSSSPSPPPHLHTAATGSVHSIIHGARQSGARRISLPHNVLRGSRASGWP